MPFFAVPDYQFELFWVSNPDPASLTPTARPEDIQWKPLNRDSPVVILLHAAGSNILGWSRQISDSRLAGRFQFLLIDCPFHGFTRAEPRPTHTLEDSANCVAALLDHLGIPSFILYGEHVHGVNVATWTAIKRKERLQGLLLASPGWRSEEPSLLQSFRVIEAAMSVNKYGNGDGSGTIPEEALEECLRFPVGGAPRMAELRKEMAKHIQQRYGTGNPDFEMRLLFAAMRDRKPIPDEQLASLTCPILILRGGDDHIISPEKAVEEWQAAFVNAKGGADVHVVSSAPATMSLSDGNIVSRLMGQFFSKCTGTA
ncbi:hypothetical protein JCM11251_000719 [Rhodosporidiobolus azoricus]